MGYPMAGHLKKGGHDVTVYNRTSKKAANWVKKYKGKTAKSPEEAAKGKDFVFICVGNDDDLRNVVLAKNGILAGIKKGSILIDNTTASANIARELHAVTRRVGVGFIDAPVSGGQAGAENGVLTVMCGGNKTHFKKAKAVIDCYAQQVSLIGGPGSGQLTKMVNQICIAGLVQGLSEGINFGLKAGLDMDKVITTISKGAAGSWQMDNRALTMCEGKFEFGIAVDWMRKDLGICIEEANSNGARLPVAALVDQFYAAVQARDGKRYDTSALIHLLMNA